MTISSEGLPAHTQMGLLEIGQMDLRNMSLLGMLGSTVGLIFGDSDEGEDEDGNERF